MIYIISYIASWILGFLMFMFFPEKGIITCLLQAHLIFGVGFFGLFNFTGHFIFSKRVAKSIGWVSNGFQKEIGLISLGIGISSIYSGLVANGKKAMPLVIVLAFFLIGAGINHIKEIITAKNINVGNVFIILPDFLIPITLLILLSLK
ncbi:stearoyl-CoA 9-desaturase [Ligilactobacillus sp. WILCCON 0076]|uniref:Stearoyl-CoA 9-desaturase n=1 Tax=Ligilactobacillus ubinensis TaxID=2876789 RepID=A0A9X2FKI1_9LACO|nr:DUF6790 family protein [Ligilactobacillus ubinensis]MCP0887359.1 stearoyl-CoA 9-desaturase [Ligilactobacillus ubinensis]